MKILHVYKDYFPVLGGIENHLRLLAREQAARGLDVSVLVVGLSGRDEESQDGQVRVIKAGRLATVASTPLSWTLMDRVRRFQADVVHLHFPYPIGELAYLMRRPAPATVLAYHSDIVRQKGLLRLYEPFLWRVLERADRILASNAPYVASSRYLSRFQNKIELVPYGIETGRFARRDDAAAAALRTRFGAGAQRPLVLSVGRLRYYKGLDTLIVAMRDVDAVLVLVGTGPMEKEWKALAIERGIADRIFFVGDVSDEELPSYYHAADLYVSSASHRSEAFGISLLEAMASGLPLISTELGTGTSFVNQDGVTGAVVQPNDPGALAAAMRDLIGDRDRLARYGRAGVARVAEVFSAAAMTERILGIYRDVLAGGPASAEGVVDVPRRSMG